MRVIVNIPLVLLFGAMMSVSGMGVAATESSVDLSGTGSTGNVFDHDGYDGDGYDRDGNDRNGYDRAGYKDGSSTDGDNNANGNDQQGSGDTADSGAGAAITAPDGARLLAAQCFQCHGTGGASQSKIPDLTDENADELTSELLEMKYSSETNEIMHRQASGYSEDQIRAIAAYFAGIASGANGGSDDDND